MFVNRFRVRTALSRTREGALARIVGATAGLVFTLPLAANAATYYISPSGSNSNSCSAAQSSSTPRQTIAGGVTCVVAGDSLVLRNGTYSGSGNTLTAIPSGNASAYVTVRAENDGGAILTGGMALDHTTAYVQFVGLRLQSATEKEILGNHLKFLRMEFKGGPSTGNVMNTLVGSNNYNDTADILFEECWFHGAGGRYNVLIYNSDRVVVRRSVIRHDGGWTDGGNGDPEAGLMIYNSANNSAQNVLVIDSSLSTYATWAGAFYSGKNSSVPHANTGNTWQGIIALNNQDLGMRLDTDSQITGVTITDAVLWDNKNGGISFGTGSVTATVSNLTIGRTKVTASGDFMGGIGGWGGGTKTIKNVIVTGYSNDFNSVSATYFDSYSNGSSISGTGKVTYNPFTNGLMYLPRIETGSTLSTAGQSGAVMGASVVNRVGAAGSLSGETNWNVVTGTALWPWPNESRIKQEMCTDAGVTRGFCSDSSLTNYVLNYLGNGNPYSSGVAPSAPANVHIVTQ